MDQDDREEKRENERGEGGEKKEKTEEEQIKNERAREIKGWSRKKVKMGERGRDRRAGEIAGARW
jgi:hypothetical protein